MESLPNCMAVVVEVYHENDVVICLLSKPLPSGYRSSILRLVSKFGSNTLQILNHFGCALVTKEAHSWDDAIVRVGDLIFFSQFCCADQTEVDWIDIRIFERNFIRGLYDKAIQQILTSQISNVSTDER